MNSAQGGYKLIDFKGIDLINEETPNTIIYKAIEESYKSKALLLSNIVIDKVEYNAVFKEIKHIDNYYTFEMYDRIIKVYADKVESIPSLSVKTIDFNTLEKQNDDNDLIRQLDIDDVTHSYDLTITNMTGESILLFGIDTHSNEQFIFINDGMFTYSIGGSETDTEGSVIAITSLTNDTENNTQSIVYALKTQGDNLKIKVNVNNKVITLGFEIGYAI